MPEIFFNGGIGRVEARFQAQENKEAPIALILHPDPRHGGTMNNKVAYTLYQTFFKRGFHVMRFNFRGVGRSQGVFDNGEGELSDAATAMDWMEANFPASKFSWVAGFSFGAWIAMQLLMRRPEIDGFMAVCPPADKYDFSFLAPCPTSGLFIGAGKDTIVDPLSVEKLAKKLMHQRNIEVEYRCIDDADHFFTSKLALLHKEMDEYLQQRIAAKLAA